MKIILSLLILLSPVAFAQSEAETVGTSEVRVAWRTWNPSFYSLASIEPDKAGEQGGRLGTYNYFTMSTFLKGQYRFALRVPFLFGTAGTDRFNGDKNNKMQTVLHDVILGFSNPELMLLPLDLGLYWEGRVYLPTSHQAHVTGMITRLRNHFILSKVFSRRWEMEYDQKYSYFVQSRATYEIPPFQDELGFEVSGAIGQTKKSELVQRLTLWGKVKPQLSFGWQLGLEDEYWNKSAAENRSRPGNQVIFTGPQARFPLTDSVNFILSVEDKVDRNKKYTELGKFYARNTQVILHSFVRF